MEKKLPALTHFVLPGGHVHVSYCHLARTICRRAERLAVSLGHQTEISPLIIKYLNRLSDYLFVLGRKTALDLGVEEVKWFPRG
jgi:cob(I)alamin adenosyltransferase